MVEFMGGPALPYDPSYHLMWRVDKIRAAVHAMRPDILEVHSPYGAAIGGVLASRRDARARTFFWHSDFIDTYGRVLLGRAPLAERATRTLWSWVRFITSRCDAVIVASRDQERKLRSHGVGRLVRIPMGVDSSVFHPREPLPRRDELVLVGVGRFAVEKRWDVVVDAVHHLRASGVRARLDLYGDGPERADLVARAKEGVRVLLFEKDRAALARALADADAFVHGCPYETFGVAIAEAVACATPIVVPDEGAAPEHVRGAAGRTYRAGDPADCARAIRELLSTDAGARRAAAELAAKDVPSIEAHFDATLELYASLVA